MSKATQTTLAALVALLSTLPVAAQSKPPAVNPCRALMLNIDLVHWLAGQEGNAPAYAQDLANCIAAHEAQMTAADWKRAYYLENDLAKQDQQESERRTKEILDAWDESTRNPNPQRHPVMVCAGNDPSVCFPK